MSCMLCLKNKELTHKVLYFSNITKFSFLFNRNNFWIKYNFRAPILVLYCTCRKYISRHVHILASLHTFFSTLPTCQDFALLISLIKKENEKYRLLTSHIYSITLPTTYTIVPKGLCYLSPFVFKVLRI